jgi:mannose/fructose/N-acetylgalactosamine-specific phosphotransferase system component IIC
MEVAIMTFVFMTMLKLGAVGGTGLAICTAFSYFHNFDWKPSKKKKEKGEADGATKVGQVLRQKTRSID